MEEAEALRLTVWAAADGRGGPLFAVDQAIHTLIGAAVDPAGIPPDKGQLGHTVAAVADTVTAVFPPHECDLALATLLLKILDPRFFVCDRLDRASLRATMKAGGFPARKDRPGVVNVTR